ncbi:uncharacterized protein LOC128235446 [Mya arenaria]|uniref:uncharacterized protein LOC128235446 n=1 Tax=Mya arenaria TaxID=6604 RepID=UPI0022E3AA45|nr:uncharacterized protein LOC128235446 [Mya arenaria]
MFVGIEHFNFTISFGDILWGQNNIVRLRDVLIVRYKVTHLPVTNIFVVDLSAHICMKNKNCEHNVTILEDTELPILPCTWNEDFANQTFSYQTWLDSNGYRNTTLNDGIRKEIFDSQGIGRYINQNKCYRSIYPYANSEHGWTTDCQSYVELPKLNSSVTCFLSDSCTAVKCCLDIEILQSSIEFELNIDACEQEIHVGIESLRTIKFMQTYEYGASEAFYLGGVLKMDYIIENFDRGRKYSISLNISVCLEFDEPCLTEVVLQSHLFPRADCNWRNGFNVEGFSLYDWKSSQNIHEHESLTPTQADILMDHLGLAQYLNDPQCITHDQWDNECPFNVHIGSSLSNVFCSIDSTCLKIDCCLAIKEIGRNFSVFVHIDDCEQKITYGIEGIEVSKTFGGFQFDRTNHFDLDGVLDVRLLVSNLLHERKFLLSLFVDEYHNDTDMPTREYGLIQNVYVPATICLFETGFRDKDFSLPLWMSTNFPSHVGQEKDDYILATLLEDIGIADYLLPQRCTVETSNAIDTSICPIEQRLQSISTSVSCALNANCIGIHCCLTSAEVHLTFDFSVDIDNCREKMIVKIERVSYTVLFKDLLWGETMNFDLDGIFKISVLADMVWSDKLFNLTISTSVCTDANGTCTEDNILVNQLLQATPCSWKSLSEVEG